MSRRPIRLLTTLLVPLLLVAAACSDSDGDNAADSSLPEVKIGVQDFSESTVLAHVYGEALDEAGFKVTYKKLGGFRDILYSAFDKGDVNFTLEYASSTLEFLNEQAGEASPKIEDVMKKLQSRLDEKGLIALDPSPAVDSNAFVVTKETSEAKHLTSLSDLTSDLRLGGFADCPTNPFCIPGLKNLYGVDLAANFVSQDGGDLTKEALKGKTIDVAVLTTTDPSIAENSWVVLKDDKGLINADNIVPILSSNLESTGGAKLTDLVDRISATLDTDALTSLNREYVINKLDAEDVAEDWLKANGFND